MLPILGVAAMISGGALAQEGELRIRGEQLARDICSGCHAVAEDQPGAVVDGAPAFPALARSSLTPAELRGALTTPHPVMPQMPLSQRDIDAVLAYIRSFAD